MKVRKMKEIQKIGTFNCQGILTSEVKKRTLADDFERHGMSFLAIQETHMKDYGVITIKSSTNKEYTLYYSGNNTKSVNGVGIITEQSRNVTFIPINDRICYLTTKVNNKQTVHVVSAYAPTLAHSEKDPEMREKFYSELESILRKFKERHIVFLCGDFNAKIGKQKHDDIYHEVCGSYGKGKPNTNGDSLLNFAKANKLVITNTYFKHRVSHRTTWISPNNTQKNQIDFILIRRNKEIRLKNSRSYGGMHTSSDHKLVLLQCYFKWPYTKKEKQEAVINLENLRNDEISH